MSSIQPAAFRSHSARLPQELCDEIIGCLSSDKAALKQCSLVCQSWMVRTSPHLFSRLLWPPCHHLWPSFDSVSQEAKLRKRCHGTTHIGESQDLLDCLTQSSRISNVVEEFYLTSVRPSLTLEIGTCAITGIYLETLSTVLDLLPRLRCLHLANCRIFPPPLGYTAPQQRRTFRKIRVETSQEYLNRCTLTTTFAHFLSHFSDVAELVIAGNIWHDTSLPGPAPDLLTRIDTLTLEPPSSAPDILLLGFPWLPGLHPWSLAYLATRLDLGALRTLNAHHSYVGRKLATAFLQHTPRLAALLVQPAFAPLQLHAATRLRALTFVKPFAVLGAGFQGAYGRGSAGFWDALLRGLQGMDSSELEELGVVLTSHRFIYAPLPQVPDYATPDEYLYDVAGVLGSADWAAMAAFLEGRPVLKRFRLELQVSRLQNGQHRLLDRSQCERIVRTAMQDCVNGRLKDISEIVVTLPCSE